MSFAHLHVHSEYSLLDGLAKIPDLVSKAKQDGSPALALTDHGVLYGAIPFYQECVKQGVKPILGCEVYVTAGARSDRTKEERHHLVLLARNKAGYRNLLQLVSKAHLEGFYHRPRVDHALLEDHADGLIALSGCIQGEIPRLLQKGQHSAAATLAQWYKGIFKDGFFLELQRHPKGMPELEGVTQGLLTLANMHNIPIVATNDSHYAWPDDYEAHDVLLCIGQGTQLSDEKRKRYPDDSFYLKGPEEMAYLFPDLPEALANTLVIADLVDLNLTFDRLELPEFSVPGAHTPDTYLADLCWKALPSLYITGYEPAKERLRSELAVIRQTGFATYMLIVADFVRYARERGIVYGPRGSAAGSIVTYCLGISDLDPIRHKLVFERFLNIERNEMPDIDMDFADSQRGAMMEYAAERYGRDHVAQIITFGTFGPKAALRDVGRVMGVPYSDVDALSKLIPEGPKIKLQQVLETVPDFRARCEHDVHVEELVEMAMRLEGVARHASTHAAGVVISRDPLVDHVPLQRPTGDSGGSAVSQYDMNVVAKVGLLKMDFLGIANLTILDQAVRMVNETAWDAIDLSKLAIDDPMVFRLIGAGHTANVFQLEGSGMTRYIKELQPTTFDDLAAMVALYRPGPIGHIPTYIARKHGKEPVEYPHPLLSDILEDTYGIIVYQDQVLQVLRRIAGYSLGQADIVRKAMGKKKPELMAKERMRFVEGAAATCGLSAAEADALFDVIEPFAGYAFNRAHASCYALVAYRTAWMKAHYPLQYMCAVLTAARGSTEKLIAAAAECRRFGIRILGPDVNRSGVNFTIEGEAIRYGLDAIKGVGELAQTILRARWAEGEASPPFAGLVDLTRRAASASRTGCPTMNKTALEALIKAGALDNFGNRPTLLSNYPGAVKAAGLAKLAMERGQGSLLDLLDAPIATEGPSLIVLPDVRMSEKVAWERELLSFTITPHPGLESLAKLGGQGMNTLAEVIPEHTGRRLRLPVLVVHSREIYTKTGQPMAFVKVEDIAGAAEVTVFPRVYEQTRPLWETGKLLIVEGKVATRDEGVNLLVDRARTSEVEKVLQIRRPSKPPGPRTPANWS